MDPLDHVDHARLRVLQLIGVASGITAGAWLGAAEAPTKMVTLGIPPVVVSLAMVVGVFLARWSVPALLRGTAAIGDDVRQAPHLVVWAVLAGCLWAVANTLTIYAIKDIGLSIAFPLWNSNSLLGIVWGVVFFSELRDAGRARWAAVLGGALVMFAGATLLAAASAKQAPDAHALRGVAAALAAGVLWGTMYIPYRKAYLTGMNPLSFITFFTVGELVMMTAIALSDQGGVAPLARELAQARSVLFWLFAGGFVWVLGDLFQQYAAKYVGISRGIPLSNTNQLWGLLWGTLVFGELQGAGAGGALTQTVAGSVLMALGAAAIALATATGAEHARWQVAAHREGARYGVDAHYVRAGLTGHGSGSRGRTWVDWTLVLAATAVLVGFGLVARVPELALAWRAMAALVAVSVVLLVGTGYALWRVTG
ncbi:MAG TPA: EamA family transporter, partial [Gemmatimonadales bacterium]|nr:EamA family transporter [Gemmatimonadales bacterium]